MENTDTDAKTERQAEMLANRLKKRFRHLRKWAARVDAGAFRLYDRDIPEIPLVLDVYGDAVHGALYERPYEKDEGEEVRWLGAMREAVARALGKERDDVIVGLRRRQRGRAQYERISGQGLVREVREGGLKFRVNLSDYLDTGLFPDRRAMRRMVREDSAGRRVLNLFCYTASFSVHAAAGGAVSTDSVDLSNTYLNRARDNFVLNGFAAETLRREEFFGKGPSRGTAHRLIRADVTAFLREAAGAGLRWDLIVADPPAFSNSSMTDGDFDLRRDFLRLLEDGTGLLSTGGRLWFSASARSFRASAAELETALSGRFPGIAVTDISGRTVDEDFRGRKTPRAFLIGRRRRTTP